MIIHLRSIDDLREHQCRWPVADIDGTHFFCSLLKQEDSSYCPSHHDRSLKRNEKRDGA